MANVWVDPCWVCNDAPEVPCCVSWRGNGSDPSYWKPRQACSNEKWRAEQKVLLLLLPLMLLLILRMPLAAVVAETWRAEK